jgi:uncharacterized protein (DUF1499 family)
MPFSTLLLVSLLISDTFGYSNNVCSRKVLAPPEKVNGGRRAFLVSSFSTLPVLVPAANAFDNRLDDKYADVRPSIGPQPSDLGVSERVSNTKGTYFGLKPCGTSPNCYCSSAPFEDSPARYLPPWGGGSIQDVKKVIDSYEVGQNNIDGGGFEIIKFDEERQYIYVQFQSYKAGYIDDFECWYNPESKTFNVRSASRLGLSDLGVNGKRLEYIATRLEKEFGWSLKRRKSGKLV